MISPLVNNDKYKKELTDFVDKNIDRSYCDVGDTAVWVEHLDNRIQEIFRNFIDGVKADGFQERCYQVLAVMVALDRDSCEFLKNISEAYYKFKPTFVYSREVNKDENYGVHYLLTNIFDHKDFFFVNLDFSWTPYNPFISGTLCRLPGPFYNSKRHFQKDWEAAQNQQGTDVTISVGNQKWYVHSVRLCAHSKYFECMFQGQFKEKLKKKNEEPIEVDLKEDEPQVIDALLKFIYLGSLDNNETQEIDMLDLYTAACKYEVEELRYFCADRINDYLQTNEVCNEEFCTMLKMGLSKVIRGQDLLKICLAHAETNERLQTVFVNVINSEAFDKESGFFPLLNICKEMKYDNLVTQLKKAI